MGEPNHPYEILDVFTATPLEGNSLAVFTEGESVPSRVMQAVARELNLSETVFLLPGDSRCDAQARIFTPAVELPFAGHPILGSAYVVGRRDRLEIVRLRTGAGIVPVRLRWEDGEIVSGEMEQPVPTWRALPEPETAALLAALGVDAAALPVEAYTNGPTHVMVALDFEDQVRALAPDLRALLALGVVGVSCFAPVADSAGSSWRTRMFGPALGVAEDPATGSAAGPLAVHLARHGQTRFGYRVELRQGVEIGRPSVLFARAEGAGDRIDAVFVGGAAVTVAHGHFRLQ
jgi:trans-2,3-dihydro-3-hydroxyanthranilate isomerase